MAHTSFIALRYGVAINNTVISRDAARRAGERLLHRGTIHLDGKEYKVDGVKLEDDEKIPNVGSLLVDITPASASQEQFGFNVRVKRSQ
jgi:hypothetical protein